MAIDAVTFLGPSGDGRTNRWQVCCPKCGHRWTPPTTILKRQALHCPRSKCGVAMVVDYTVRTVTASRLNV